MQYHAMLDMNRFEWMLFANPLKHLTRAPSVAAGGSLRLGTYCNALTSDSWQAGAAQWFRVAPPGHRRDDAIAGMFGLTCTRCHAESCRSFSWAKRSPLMMQAEMNS